jgi:thioredoxin 1
MAFEFTDANFAEKANEGVVMVDFWAEWCGPCKTIGPYVEEISSEYASKALVGKLDVDNNPNTSFQFGVRAIPTILFLKDGKVVDKQVGLVTKQALKDKLNAVLNLVTA